MTCDDGQEPTMVHRDLPIRVLSLWRPWPAAILLGPKRVENRPRRWRIPEGGMLLVLHGAKRWDKAGALAIRELWPEFNQVRLRSSHPSLETGLVGVVLVRDVVHISEVADLQHDPWAFGPYCYRLSHPVPFRRRWEMRGSQGLFRVGDEALEELIRREWAEGVERQGDTSGGVELATPWKGGPVLGGGQGRLFT